jgi:hypothetical protein
VTWTWGNAGRAVSLALTFVAACAVADYCAADDEAAGARPGKDYAANDHAKNDYPTVDRVEYVQECMRHHPGARYEMLYKCACVLDHIAARIPYEQYVELWTAANAMSIGGERGSYLRDAEAAREMAATFRSVERVAQQQCFLRRD